MGDVLVFTWAARLLARESRGQGWECPSFRSPPRLDGADRSLRRRAPGVPPQVSVRLRGRSREAVLADMVEGVVVANGLIGVAAASCRLRLWAALAPEWRDAA